MTARVQFDNFIKNEWQDIFRTEVHVKLDNGTRYVPNGGSQGVQLLRKNINAFDEAIRLWSIGGDSGAPGYDRIVEQAGVEYTWEWFLIDPTRPWASSVPDPVRRRIRSDLDRRKLSALAAARFLVKKTERQELINDDRIIKLMNAKRIQEQRPSLTTKQEVEIRQRRIARRS